ncbi:PTS sugar transporter subunit IIC [Companilactobacillus zhachilii]|jgi:PTS system, lactose/cellobiose family IIC component|uniref:Permease IIC component n=1 Tax=Companilactobacillus zhachilii TaxID=2304606 RepID=A0A386PP54_9LACO|nr:PTS sugar transporter subunit IIC [Companilactobacillus zhachilii]AYE37264.1 PTS sugar transporter subunit IIC [Companilactobacillus zhachilii]
MNKLLDTLDAKFAQPMSKISEQRHLRAIRDGVVSAIPLIIVGSFFLIIAFPPIPKDWGFYIWATKHALQILIPYRLTFWIMSLYICFGIGYNLSKSYGMDPLQGGQLSVAAFLLSIMPVTAKQGLMLPMESLGSVGIFPCMILSIFAVEVMHMCVKHNWTFKMPKQVPSSVAHSFEAIIPAAIIILVMTMINVVFKINLEQVIQWIFSPLVKAGDTLPGVIIPAFLVVFFWFFGIHGDSIVGSVARPIWLQYFTENAEKVANHATPTHIAPETFFQWFIWIGGSGATIGLIICAVMIGKAKYTKSITRACLVPAIFNINEPIIFGFPVMLNPIFLIPFILAPMVMVLVTWFAFSLGFVNMMFVQPPWTLPAPIGAYIATGGDWRAIVLCLINILISVVIYYPFVRMYDRAELKKEQEGLDEDAESSTSEEVATN